MITQFASEKRKTAVYNPISTNRNSFDALSEIGLICGVFIGVLGLLIVLTRLFSGSATHINNTGVMLIFFSLVLLMNGAAGRREIAEARKKQKSIGMCPLKK